MALGKKIKIHETILPMSETQRLRELPYLMVKLVAGARIQIGAEGHPELVAVTWNGQIERYHLDDVDLANLIAAEFFKEIVEAGGEQKLVDATMLLRIHAFAAKRLETKLTKPSNLTKVICLKDRTGSGYWRMVMPTRYLDPTKFDFTITETGVGYDRLLEYDVVFMQRNHTWEEYYLVERLKIANKKIVYDIDDDIFHISPSNAQAFHRIGEDEQAAAIGIMRLVDVITTPSEFIKETFGFASKTVVIPNALDLSDDWPDEARWGSPEPNLRRILWAGSSSHSADWQLFIEPLDAILKHYNTSKEGFKVNLLILGYLPPVIQNLIAERDWWNNHVEYQPFTAVETYISLMKKIRADVGIVPLENIPFNASKSPLKWIEYSACGIPTVASKVPPYTQVIKHGVNGFLADGNKEVIEAIDYALRFDKTDKLGMLGAARQAINDHYDIRKVVSQWKNVLTK